MLRFGTALGLLGIVVTLIAIATEAGLRGVSLWHVGIGLFGLGLLLMVPGLLRSRSR